MNEKQSREKFADDINSSPSADASPEERLKRLILKKLQEEDSQLDASHIEVALNNTELVLSGHVGYIEDKRKVEKVAKKLEGITSVENRILLKEEERRAVQVSSPASSEATDEKEIRG